jgi:methylmalonyl-CoA mutase N-terminal domain/subunit
VDPFAGSYFIEALTDEIESRALELIAKVDELGGSTNAIEFITGEIDESAWGYQERYRLEQDVVVGVNRYVEEDAPEVDEELLRVDPEGERAQVERLRAWKERRDADRVERALAGVRETAAGPGNLLPVLREALRAGASVGEACGALRDVFGTYQPSA